MAQSLTVGTSGGNKDVTSITIGGPSSNLTVIEGWVGTASGNKQFFTSEAVSLAGGNASDTKISPLAATATLTFASAGTISGTGGLSSAWVSPAPPASAAAYEIRATVFSGSTPSTGTVGSWLALSSDRSWSNTRNTTGTRTTVLTIEIRRASDGTVLATAAYTVEATQEV